MMPEQTELLRGGILLQLHAAYPCAMREPTILTNLRLIGGIRDLDRVRLAEELRYLESKGMLERRPVVLGAGAQDYLLTEAGRDYLDRAGLI